MNFIGNSLKNGLLNPSVFYQAGVSSSPDNTGQRAGAGGSSRPVCVPRAPAQLLYLLSLSLALSGFVILIIASPPLRSPSFSRAGPAAQGPRPPPRPPPVRAA